MLASVAGEVAVVAVDHRQAGAHVAREVEGRESGTKRERREGVPEIVDAPQRLDADGLWAGRMLIQPRSPLLMPPSVPIPRR